jgi:protein gp37
VSKIQWTEVTWNPVTGCDRTSPGCDNCYALTLAKRLKGMGQAKYQNDGDPRTSGSGFRLTLHPDVLDEPLRWRKPRTVFVNSMSDLFHPDVPDDFIARAWAVMARADRHTFQVLTKRPQRMASLLGDELTGPESLMYELHEEAEAAGLYGAMWPLPNVWLGTSIENDRYAFRADHLRATPAAVRFLSVEPMLGPVPSLDLTGVDWLIIGGESGPGARPMDLDWAHDLMAKADEAGTAVFVKQVGSVLARRLGYEDRKGGDITEWPEWLQVRDMPSAAGQAS